MKKRQYIVFIILVALFSAGLTWFLFFRPQAKDNLSIVFIDQDKFKVGERVDPVTLIKSSSSINILYPTINTDKPGEKHLAYIAVGENGTQKEFIKVIYVISPSAPILELKKDTVTINVGEKIMLESYIQKAWDEFDGNLKAEIKGTYDAKKAGTYEILYKVKNSSGKETEKKLKLIVKTKEKEEPKKDNSKVNDQATTNEKQNVEQNENINQSSVNKNEVQIPQRKPQESELPQNNSTIGTGQREWMIEDGQSFDELRNSCMQEGAKSGASQYTCDLIYEDDIAVGYRLYLN